MKDTAMKDWILGNHADPHRVIKCLKQGESGLSDCLQKLVSTGRGKTSFLCQL